MITKAIASSYLFTKMAKGTPAAHDNYDTFEEAIVRGSQRNREGNPPHCPQQDSGGRLPRPPPYLVGGSQRWLGNRLPTGFLP